MTDYTRSQLHRMNKKDLQALLASLGVEIIEPKNPNKAELVGAIMEKQGRMTATGEEQSAQPAGATLVDVSKPYCFQIDRTDTDPPTLLTWGGLSTAPVNGISARTAATYEAAQASIAHNYFGPRTVRMWPKRENEHYRMEPPQGCYRLDLPDRTGTTPQELRDEIDALHTVKGIAWPANPNLTMPETK